MAVHVIKKGLNLPIQGAPKQVIQDGPPVTHVALMADDYPLMKPRFHVNVGDTVKRGQLLFEDRKTDGVLFTSPGAGEVVAINRGARRVLESVVIRLSEGEQSGKPGKDELQTFETYTGKKPADLDGDAVRALLKESGMWTALRARPFSRVPAPTEDCKAIFVTACDSHPLTADPAKVLSGQMDAFHQGLHALATLTEGPVYLCIEKSAQISHGDVPGIKVEKFTGKHPYGVVGTHIHVLEPVWREKVVWHIGYQAVAAIGRLFSTGTLSVERVFALGGPMVKSPTLLKSRVGASIDELTDGAIKTEGENRTISGSVFHGRHAQGDVFGFAGRYTNQITCMREDRDRVFIGWLLPGLNKFSTVRAFAAGLMGNKGKFEITTSTHGDRRAMVPIGMFERVMPLDLMPTFLLRSLAVGDLERAEALGCLELDEEDLSLCTFVSPGKVDFGAALRETLNTIWKEG